MVENRLKMKGAHFEKMQLCNVHVCLGKTCFEQRALLVDPLGVFFFFFLISLLYFQNFMFCDPKRRHKP